jgi:hypothetical protein
MNYRLTSILDSSRNILNDMLLFIALADCKVDVLVPKNGICEV